MVTTAAVFTRKPPPIKSIQMKTLYSAPLPTYRTISTQTGRPTRSRMVAHSEDWLDDYWQVG